MKPPMRLGRPRRLGRPLRTALARGASGVPAGAPRSALGLLVAGDLVLDVVVTRTSEIVPGSDIQGTVRFRAGGSAANTARAVASLGGNATFVGAVGDDGVGRMLTAALRREGVNVRTVIHAAPTARLVVLLGPGGERSFITERGAAEQLEPRDLDAAWFRGVRAVHLPFYSLVSEPLGAASRRAVEMAREVVAAAVVSIDLSSAAPLRAFGVRAAARVIRSLAPDVLFANEGEASVFGARNRAEKLLELSPIVVIKQGRAGCEVLARGRGSEGEASVLRITVATRPIATSDTTGAGDAFDAGFLVSLLESVASPVDATLADLRRAAVAGNRAAAKLLTTPRAELTW